MKLITLATLAAIISPPAFASVPCMIGEPNDTLAKWMSSTGQRPILKLEIDTGKEPWPAIVLGKPDGSFSIVLLMNGMSCVLAVGHGMAPAALDLKFPAVVLPGKPS